MTEQQKIGMFILACVVLPGGLFVLSLAILHWIKYKKITLPVFNHAK
jgi:hypothetical protein